MSWTDERVELLSKLWNEGQSASQIAKELGGVTRNAVIGKVHRLGLSNRTGGAGGEAAKGGAKAAPKGKSRAASSGKTAAKKASGAKGSAAAASAANSAPGPAAASDGSTAAKAPPPMSPARRAIIPAGQPLPPQPSANEIDPVALARVSEIEKKAKKLNLMELTERTCKWPVGDPATPDFWFCGLPVQQGKPYCEAHVGVAYQPMNARRDRRR